MLTFNTVTTHVQFSQKIWLHMITLELQFDFLFNVFLSSSPSSPSYMADLMNEWSSPKKNETTGMEVLFSNTVKSRWRSMDLHPHVLRVVY